MDFVGFRSAKNHHSKSSLYYNEESRFSGKEFKKSFEVPDKYGQPIFTEDVFNDSRKSLERFIGRVNVKKTKV